MTKNTPDNATVEMTLNSPAPEVPKDASDREARELTEAQIEAIVGGVAASPAGLPGRNPNKPGF